MNRLIYVAVLGSLAGACATTPIHSDELNQARAEVQVLSADPLAQQAAGKDLEEARTKLQQAESAVQQRKPPDVVDHLAYLALRHAQSGEARVNEARAGKKSRAQKRSVIACSCWRENTRFSMRRTRR